MTKTIVRGLAAVTCFAAVGCASLDIANPNEPNNKSALADPNAIESVAAGAIRTWFNAYTDLRGAGVLVTQARSFSSSWNNGNILTYDAVANPTAPPDQWVRTVGWRNDPASNQRTSIDAFWSGGLDESATPRGGFYNSLSSANDALSAIRKNGVVINNASDTKRAETIAAFMQGASLMMFALSYDKAYIVTDSTTDAQLAALAYSNRKLLRDTAVVKLKQAIALASANTFTTPAAWTNGVAYTNVQIAQIANTMAAMTLAYYPRDSTELAGVDWAAVEGFASNGMGSGTPVDFMLVQDGYASWISELMSWFDAIELRHSAEGCRCRYRLRLVGDGDLPSITGLLSPVEHRTNPLRLLGRTGSAGHVQRLWSSASDHAEPGRPVVGRSLAPAEQDQRKTVWSDRQDARNPRRSADVGAQRWLDRHHSRRPVHVQRHAGLDGRSMLALVGSVV